MRSQGYYCASHTVDAWPSARTCGQVGKEGVISELCLKEREIQPGVDKYWGESGDAHTLANC